jgi:hypothetical protein
MRKAGLITISVIVCMTVLGCTTSIESIRQNPGQYAGKEVRIQGEITKKMPLPLTDYSLCIVNGTSEEMILFALKDYSKGDMIMTTVHVIGASEQGARKSAQQIADSLIEFLIENKVTERKIAERISKGLVMVVSNITGAVEGSYLLVEVE